MAVRHRVCAAVVLAVALAGVAMAGVFPEADILVAAQEPDGSWIETGGNGTLFTGYNIAGLVRAYDLSQDPTYKTSAEKAGTWLLANRNPSPNAHLLLGEDAYGVRRLSEIAANPSSNVWRTELTNLFSDISNLYPGGTTAYIDYYRDLQIDISIATDSIAHYVVAADYVGAADLATWRSKLVDALAMVDDNTAFFPVLALGSTVWALVLTGDLDHTLVDPSAAAGSVWDGVYMDDLPGILWSHQYGHAGESDLLGYGSFYWRFDHSTPAGSDPSCPAYGYTEDAVFGTLGLQASALYGYGPWGIDVAKALGIVHDGFGLHHDKPEGYMNEHLWAPCPYTYYVYGGEALRLAVPEPGSMALLGGCLVALALRRRRRRGPGDGVGPGMPDDGRGEWGARP